MLLVIFIGSVRIRGEYLNSMFVAVAMDGNNNTTAIAFSIRVANNVNSCTWFLMRLKDAIGEGREVAFITNMDDTISSFVGQYIQQTFAERSVVGGMSNTVFTPYVEMVLHKRMQKSLRWKATKIPPKISSPFPSDIFRIFDLKRSCVVDLNRHTCSCGK
uniref:MULE transposase domain-containing protein n=1 Tax=Lactuca sativa TaxID=4236 RepID=A0A9R1WWK4_LACSA|nr:hypothetical protein LSAT_V11C800401270 [Lactuca sativa]